MNNIIEILAENDVVMDVRYDDIFKQIEITFSKYSFKEKNTVHYKAVYSRETLADHIFIELDIKERLLKFLSSDKFAVPVQPVIFPVPVPDPISETLTKESTHTVTLYYIDYGCGLAVFSTPDEDKLIPRFLYRAQQIGLAVGYKPNLLRMSKCEMSVDIYESLECNSEKYYWRGED